MSNYSRSKGNKKIYDVVHEWYASTDIPYVAHIITKSGDVERLGVVKRCQATDNTSFHPDQLFWKENKSGIITKLERLGLGNVSHIEIDCKLLPCNVMGTGCLYKVPSLMRDCGLINVDVLIFSHKEEFIAKIGISSKKKICINTKFDNTTLSNAYSAMEGWGWVP